VPNFMNNGIKLLEKPQQASPANKPTNQQINKQTPRYDVIASRDVISDVTNRFCPPTFL